MCGPGHGPRSISVSLPVARGVKAKTLLTKVQKRPESNHLDGLVRYCGLRQSAATTSKSRSASDGITRSAELASADSSYVLVTATVRIPAARADSSPQRESSMATQSPAAIADAVAARSCPSARTYGSGAGLL